MSRGIDRCGNLERRALTPQAKPDFEATPAEACLNPEQFSALGAGFLTETARCGIPLPEAMQQSQHRSVHQAARYYNDSNARWIASAGPLFSRLSRSFRKPAP